LEEGTRRLRSSSLLHGMRLNSLWTKECNLSKSTNCRTGSTRNKKICAYFNKPSSMSAAHAHGGGARERARDVNHRIVEDRAGEPPIFGRASQNVVVVAILLRNMPKPSNPEVRRARDEIRGLLETAALQQAESSASRRRELALELPTEPSRQEREASVHPKHAQQNKAASVRECIIDNREPRDARDNITEHRRCKCGDGATQGYHEHMGGRYNSSEDRSPSPEPPGPRVFSKAIRETLLSARFRPPMTLTKYNSETKPELWLTDFRLACQLGGATDDRVIIQQLPLFLSDTARAWLGDLPPR
jgi:hypothetical protein